MYLSLIDVSPLSLKKKKKKVNKTFKNIAFSVVSKHIEYLGLPLMKDQMKTIEH